MIPKCIKENNQCETHKDNKYLKWKCNYEFSSYNPEERRQKFINSKIPCKYCGKLSVNGCCKKCFYSNEFISKIKGKKLPQWWKDKITNKFENGEKHPNWKGGISPENKVIRRSNEFKEWRLKVFERDKYTCQVCKIKGNELHPHHIKPFCDYPELRFDVSNGQTLCKDCHKKTDTWGKNKTK